LRRRYCVERRFWRGHGSPPPALTRFGKEGGETATGDGGEEALECFSLTTVCLVGAGSVMEALGISIEGRR
jgi:hypothetical protein